MPDDDLDYGGPDFWLRQADGDLVIARARLAGLLPEHRLFHAQQAVEKALKGVLVARNLPYPRTHNIRLLLDQLRENGVAFPEAVKFAGAFSEYEAVARHPEHGAIPARAVSEEGCETAASVAAEVVEWAKNEIGRTGE